MALAKLGDFLFEAKRTSFSSIDRECVYEWSSQKRLGNSPARQFQGKGDETIELPGIIYPHMFGGLDSLNKIRDLAGSGKPQVLSYTDEKKGQYMGKWTIDRISEVRSHFIKEGAAKKIEFTIVLTRYNE